MNSDIVSINGLSLYKSEVSGTTVSLNNIKTNTYYVCTSTTLSSLSIGSFTNLANNVIGEFIIEFSCPSRVPTISKPSTMLFADGWEQADFEKGYKYILYVLNNVIYVSYAKL